MTIIDIHFKVVTIENIHAMEKGLFQHTSQNAHEFTAGWLAIVINA